MKNFKNLIREIKTNNKKELTKKQKALSFQVKAENADKKILEEKNKIKKINEILKFRDPILESMSYESWTKIEQNQLIVELDMEQAKFLYESDMFRAAKVQTAANAKVGGRSGRSGRSGAGGGGGRQVLGRRQLRRRKAGPPAPPHIREIVTAATTSGSPHAITKPRTLSKPTVSAEAFFQLPAATSVTPYYDYLIKDTKGIAATHNITITSAGGAIDGGTSHVLSSNYGMVFLFSDGTNWFIY